MHGVLQPNSTAALNEILSRMPGMEKLLTLRSDTESEEVLQLCPSVCVLVYSCRSRDQTVIV